MSGSAPSRGSPTIAYCANTSAKTLDSEASHEFAGSACAGRRNPDPDKFGH